MNDKMISNNMCTYKYHILYKNVRKIHLYCIVFIYIVKMVYII